MIIDTGTHAPIRVPQPHYGMHESPIMQRTIDELLKLKFIKPDVTSPWGFRITLAPKPHQEDCTNINDFVWRFCINYISLNRITRPASYPIPRCDDAVMFGFGHATFFILIDAHSGYHQIRLSPESMLKTAFFAPHGRKYVYCVMPFGLRNAPAIFVAMMHDLKALWTELSVERGVPPSDSEGSTIIIDDIFVFAVSEDNTFILLECIAKIARKYHLTLKLKKCQWFPQDVEFVGVDISIQGNSPARSKFQYLHSWADPTTPRAIMSFLGFAMFYNRWIPFFEIKASPLRNLIKAFPIDYTFSKDQFTPKAFKAYNELKANILSKPILQRANIRKRFYLKTDFSSKSLGFALCQPADDKQSMDAMNREINGGECEFDINKKGLRLLPIAFGSRRTKGNEVHYHSHPGEAIAAAWAILKNRHFLWGREFTLISDCAALQWLMTYDGANHAVKRLQLEMTGYYFTVVHRPGRMLEDANFLSRLSEEVNIDPLLKDYLSFARQIYTDNTPPTAEINHQNTPGRRKRKANTSDTTTPNTTSSLAQLNYKDTDYKIIDNADNNTATFHISNVPIQYDTSEISHQFKSNNMNNQEFTTAAASTSQMYWILSEPKFGQWLEICRDNGIPFQCLAAVESSQECRDVLQHYHGVQFIFPSLSSAVKQGPSTFMQYHAQGYHATFDKSDILSNSFIDSCKQHIQFINDMRNKCRLKLAIFEFHDKVDQHTLDGIQHELQSTRWITDIQTIQFQEFSDNISGDIHILSIIPKDLHHGYKGIKTSLIIDAPPLNPINIQAGLMSKFNIEKYSIPELDGLFDLNIINEKNHRSASIAATLKPKLQNEYYEEGYNIYDTSYPAPLPTYNQDGLFGQLFGILFRDIITNKALCRSIATIEYCSLFGFNKNFTYTIASKMHNINILNQTTPANSLYAVILASYNHLHATLMEEIKSNSAILNTNLSPASLLNGTISHRLPSEEEWTLAYKQDDNTRKILTMLEDPSLQTNESIKQIHHIYRMPMRKSMIIKEDNKLILLEPTTTQPRSIKLIIVPEALQKHIFHSFHTNPMGGHFSLYQTLHRIRLRFHWPGMYKFVNQMITNCPACILKNNAAKPSSELLYSFPLDAPMATIHVDFWQPGKHLGFNGESGIIGVVCHMTTFAAIEPIKEANSESFARAVYKIMMRYGLASLIVTDPDSKFKKEFSSVCKLLQIPHHLGAKGNHKAIITERFYKFLNSGLRVFINERNTPRVFIEGVETLCYAWNSAPVTGTDLSRSLLVTGREFKFPIDIELQKHTSYNLDEIHTKSYANEMGELLTKCRDIYKLLIEEHRSMHREYRNAQLANPRKFSIGDIVFANVQVQSSKDKGKIQKLSYTRRGPYKIIKSHPSGSYDLTLVNHKTSNAVIKKHGSDLILCPKVLQPHRPIQSSDQIYSETNKSIIPNPFSEIHIDGYNPANPWKVSEKVSSQLLNINNNHEDHMLNDHFPTVQEMDDEFDSWPESGNPFKHTESAITPQSGTNVPSQNIITSSNGNDSTNAIKPTANTPILALPSILKDINFPSLIQSIIASEDKLFFINYIVPNGQRKEWKLAQLDFSLSVKKSKSCISDGMFIMNFLIEHPHDISLSHPHKRFWTEYHKLHNPKRIHTNFEIIKPSDITQRIAKEQGLVPYREWTNLKDSSILLHGPFDFAVINGRKTRDKIDIKDWKSLANQSGNYDNQPPSLNYSSIHHIQWNEADQYEFSDENVAKRVSTFVNNLTMEVNDTIPSMFH